jgi:hypothetical protein
MLRRSNGDKADENPVLTCLCGFCGTHTPLHEGHPRRGKSARSSRSCLWIWSAGVGPGARRGCGEQSNKNDLAHAPQWPATVTWAFQRASPLEQSVVLAVIVEVARASERRERPLQGGDFGLRASKLFDARLRPRSSSANGPLSARAQWLIGAFLNRGVG